MIRILLAEDHALVSDGLRLLLSVQPDMTLLDYTDRGEAVVAMVQSLKPDVLLLDIGLPGLDGIAIMRALAESDLSTRVLVVTARLDVASVRTSLALGACGYLSKSENSDALLAAIRQVFSGHHFVSQEVAHALEPLEALENELTAREQEVLHYVGQSLSSKEIAQQLGISLLTVRKHRENLCRKLQAHSTAELVAYAIRAQSTNG